MGLFLPFACAVGAGRGPVVLSPHSFQCCGECSLSVPTQAGPLVTAPARGAASARTIVFLQTRVTTAAATSTPSGALHAAGLQPLLSRAHPFPPALEEPLATAGTPLHPGGASRLSSAASRGELQLASAPLRPIPVPGPAWVQADWDDCRGAVRWEGPGRSWSNRSSGPGAPQSWAEER